MNVSHVFIIGTSAGGVSALHHIIENLNPAVKSPIIVVQHLPDIKHVDVKTVYPGGDERAIVEVEDKMPVEERYVYFAPGGYHMVIEKDGTFSLSQDEPIRYSRPSIDLSFESAAAAFGPKLTAIVLTGANSDGADGLKAVREHGGACVIQDPREAEYPAMPQAALEAVEPDYVSSLEELPSLMLKIETGGAR
jgi:two-component system chemotaxis response regulator CheB